MNCGGSTSMPDLTLALQLLASVIDQALRTTAGGRPAWALVFEVDGVAQYVSNTGPDAGLELVEEMIAHWRAANPAAAPN